jgi:hypothetical protein
MWRIYLVDRDAPQAVKDAARHYYLRYHGPGGMTESDDLENWSYATEASLGPIARRYPYNYQMGMGHRQPLSELKGAFENGEYSEGNARAFYKRWRQFMEGRSWDDLMAPSRKSVAEAAHG